MSALPVILGILPGFAWLLFYLKDDMNPEPKKLIALTFVNGAGIAFLALAVQLGLKSIFDQIGVAEMSIVWLVTFAASEEFLKFWAAYAAVHNQPEFDEPIDAMIYTVTAALGFATVENIAILSGGGAAGFYLQNTFHIVTFRFLGATLLHTLASGVLGYHWALGIRRFKSGYTIFVGLIAATFLHGTFNYLVIHFGEKGFSIIFLVVAAFFVLADFEKLKGRSL